MKLSDLLEMSLARPEGIADLLKILDHQSLHYNTVSFNADTGKQILGIDTYATELGWKRIGRGTFGRVYGHPNYPYCIKIFMDTSYLEWIRFCKANQHNVMLPIFKGEPVKTKGGLYVIRIELLEPLKDVNKFEDFFEDIHAIMTYTDSNGEPPYGQYDEDMIDIAMAFLKVERTKSYNGTMLALDLAARNVMMRGHQLVVTDPWM